MGGATPWNENLKLRPMIMHHIGSWKQTLKVHFQNKKWMFCYHGNHIVSLPLKDCGNNFSVYNFDIWM